MSLRYFGQNTEDAVWRLFGKSRGFCAAIRALVLVIDAKSIVNDTIAVTRAVLDGTSKPSRRIGLE